MTASDTVSSRSGAGWPAAEPDGPGSGTGWPGFAGSRQSSPDGGRARWPRRQIWQPPQRGPEHRQSLGRPYVWDGGQTGPVRPRPTVPPAADALDGPVRSTERAVIADHLRVPTAWCQAGACIAWHTDARALGEADIRARAIAAGWCLDAFGRLICPACQQRYPVWSARPVVRRDRHALRSASAAAERHIGRHRRTFDVRHSLAAPGFRTPPEA